MTAGAVRGAVFYAIGLLSITSLVFATVRVQDYRYRPYLHETLYLPSGTLIKEVSLGYQEVTADIVWLAATQYYGDFRSGNHNLDYFRGLIDIVTDLDPNFIFAYIFGAMVVSEDAGDFDAGIDILKKGMANNPTSWRLPFEAGFLLYVNRHDLDVAARYFDLSSRMPGAPMQAKRFAAFVYTRAGDDEAAIEMWQWYSEFAEEPWLRDMAKRYIYKIENNLSIHGRPDGI